jgi:hypothetical protein
VLLNLTIVCGRHGQPNCTRQLLIVIFSSDKISDQFSIWDFGGDYRYGLTKVVGFLRVLRFPPTGKVDRVG